MVSYLIKPSLAGYKWEVLILVVVDDGLVQWSMGVEANVSES